MGEVETGWIAELCSGDDERAEAAAVKLAEHGPAALPALIRLLASPDVDTRWWAGRTLAGIPGPQSVAMLLPLLDDPDPCVRQCAALGLRALFQQMSPDIEAVPALIHALHDSDPLVTSLAGDALATIGKGAVPALLKVMEDGSQPARLEAVRALARIADPSSIPALMAIFGEGSSLMEYWAGEGLDRMGLGMVYLDPG